jgi:hypothetical protein
MTELTMPVESFAAIAVAFSKKKIIEFAGTFGYQQIGRHLHHEQMRETFQLVWDTTISAIFTTAIVANSGRANPAHCWVGPKTPRSEPSAAGDSGSMIVDRATQRATALLCAGSASHTIGNHMSDVLAALGVALET